jgi:hypothetical protein
MTALRGRPLGEKGGVSCQALHLTEAGHVDEGFGPQAPEKVGSSKLLGDNGGDRGPLCTSGPSDSRETRIQQHLRGASC